MMKRKFLAVVLPIVGCATLVGSGFSAWYFGSTGQADSAWYGTVDVTDEIVNEGGVITLKNRAEENDIASSEYLILDQGSVNTASDTYSDIGISFSSTKSTATIDNTKTWAMVARYNDPGQTLMDLYNNTYKIEVTLKVKLHNILEKYVVLNTSHTATVKNDVGIGILNDTLEFEDGTTTEGDYTVYTMKYIPDIETVNQATVNWTITMDLSTEQKKNALLTYEKATGGTGNAQTFQKPKTPGELTAMTGALEAPGVSNLIVFDAEIAIVDR